MSLSFGGLATGLDTNSIINELMQLERRPIARLQSDKAWQSGRLAALGSLDSKLQAFLKKIEDLDSSSDLRAKETTLSSEEFFTASADPNALPGSYEIEVVSLAQVEKSVSQGFADKAAKDFGTGTISLTRGTEPAVSVTIDTENNSLEGIAKAINDANAGMTASIINDGTESPYRLVITGETVGEEISIDFSGLTVGTSSFAADLNGEYLTETQTAQKAHIRVDNIDIYTDSNTFTEAIPDVTLTLSAAELGTKTTLNVGLDEDAIKGKIKDFVSGYNDVAKFITGQSKTEDKQAGILVGDSGVNSIKRHLQDMLTSPVSNLGIFSTLSQLGLETQKDGTLSIDDEILGKAISENLDSVEKLLVGENGVEGMATQFKNYLDDMTNSIDGFFKGRKDSIEANLKRIDNNIERVGMRLEKREENLRNQFNALEQLVSTMNSQGNYIASQMKALENLWSYSK